MAGPDHASAAASADHPEEMVEPAVPERIQWMTGMLEPRPGERIVDLGCGTGDALAMIAKRQPADLVGIDASVAALRAAAGTLVTLPGGSRLLIQADLSRPIPLADASVDRALCHNVLEFLADPDPSSRRSSGSCGLAAGSSSATPTSTPSSSPLRISSSPVGWSEPTATPSRTGWTPSTARSVAG